MGEEKTIEQLEAEYKILLQEKLDAANKEKAAQELAASEAKKKAEYEEEFKKKYNLTATSRLDEKPDREAVNMTADKRSFEQFKADFVRHKNLKGVTGRTYEQILQDIQDKKGAMEI